MKKQVENWLLLADKDISAAGILLKNEYPLTNIVAFHCQQAIEKYLKAFLIEKDIPVIKTHDLIKLNSMVNEVTNFGLDEKELITINEVYIESRYPGELGLIPDGMPSFKQAKGFFEFAEKVKNLIKKEILIA